MSNSEGYINCALIGLQADGATLCPVGAQQAAFPIRESNPPPKSAIFGVAWRPDRALGAEENTVQLKTTFTVDASAATA